MSGWIYEQDTGVLLRDGKIVGIGYSGRGEGLNDPADEAVANMGPIPRGSYTIGPAFTHPAAGPVCMRLTPLPGTDTHGRDGFMMHGDTVTRDHTASHGCVIQDRAVRELVAASPDRRLDVVLSQAARPPAAPAAPATATRAPPAMAPQEEQRGNG